MCRRSCRRGGVMQARWCGPALVPWPHSDGTPRTGKPQVSLRDPVMLLRELTLAARLPAGGWRLQTRPRSCPAAEGGMRPGPTGLPTNPRAHPASTHRHPRGVSTGLAVSHAWSKRGRRRRDIPCRTPQRPATPGRHREKDGRTWPDVRLDALVVERTSASHRLATRLANPGL